MLYAPPRLQQQSPSDVTRTASNDHRCGWIRPASSNARPPMRFLPVIQLDRRFGGPANIGTPITDAR